jgi:hypothetical protein
MSERIAYCLVRQEPVYRRDSFVRGLRAAGFRVSEAVHAGKPGDVMVIWNRYGWWHEIASQFERAGGTVLVAENAYFANDRADRKRYALARSYHNGRGWWPQGGPERWDSLGATLKPWRADGSHILLCPNRSFGTPGGIMDPDWAAQVTKTLRRYSARMVINRPHPGNDAPKRPLALDLKDAWAVVVWSSSAGVEALVEGIPVFCTAPWWCAMPAATRDLSLVNNPPLLDRMPAMHSLAWQQWHIEEIAQGVPFQYLCD